MASNFGSAAILCIQAVIERSLKAFMRVDVVQSFNAIGYEARLRLRTPKGNVIGIATFMGDEVLHDRSNPTLVLEKIAQEMGMSLFSSIDIWIAIAKDELKFKDILGIRDIEQRMVALKRYGVEKILHDTKATLVHKSARCNELYCIPVSARLFSQDAFYLKYSDPSTGRIYISGVPPEMGATKDADACMAWKHGLSTEAYKMLANEA